MLSSRSFRNFPSHNWISKRAAKITRNIFKLKLEWNRWANQFNDRSAHHFGLELILTSLFVANRPTVFREVITDIVTIPKNGTTKTIFPTHQIIIIKAHTSHKCTLHIHMQRSAVLWPEPLSIVTFHTLLSFCVYRASGNGDSCEQPALMCACKFSSSTGNPGHFFRSRANLMYRSITMSTKKRNERMNERKKNTFRTKCFINRFVYKMVSIHFEKTDSMCVSECVAIRSTEIQTVSSSQQQKATANKL